MEDDDRKVTVMEAQPGDYVQGVVLDGAARMLLVERDSEGLPIHSIAELQLIAELYTEATQNR